MIAYINLLCDRVCHKRACYENRLRGCVDRLSVCHLTYNVTRQSSMNGVLGGGLIAYVNLLCDRVCHKRACYENGLRVCVDLLSVFSPTT